MIQFEDVTLGAAGFRLSVPLAKVPAGQATALVGRNGAGKTSLIETMLGLRSLRSGHISIDGQAASVWLRSLANKRRMGVQLQSMSYPGKTRVREVVQLHAVVYACAPAADLDSMFEVSSLAGHYYEDLSRGEKQRLDLYVALAHSPDLLLLDEPCTGLDAKFHARALQWLASWCQRPDKTVLFATHDAQELGLAHGLLRIDGGVVRQSTVAAGLAALGEYCGELAAPQLQGNGADMLARASRLPALTSVRRAPDERVLAFGNGAAFKQAFENLAQELQAPHALRLVNHADLLQAAAHEEP
jgi:ABC-2 type transport system ATP-binding protein